jgi:hypothetical protein
VKYSDIEEIQAGEANTPPAVNDSLVACEGALLSEDRSRRHLFWKSWAAGGEVVRWVCFIGFAPIRDGRSRLKQLRGYERLTRAWGFSGFYELNAYSAFGISGGYIRRCQREGLSLADPANLQEILDRAKQSELIIACWGDALGTQLQEEVCESIDSAIHCLSITQNKRPRSIYGIGANEGIQLFSKKK